VCSFAQQNRRTVDQGAMQANGRLSLQFRGNQVMSHGLLQRLQ
jgi:hypothetical protein